ncbi:MAG TPA: hypothetical protein VL866_05940 [Pyrinomonadaceae bacterium]|nr:hypothetical protein [Pyrinomonadaceae bacterium]
MDCEKVEEEILESIGASRSLMIQSGINAHLGDCLACSSFAANQKSLDVLLSAMLTPPEMSREFRPVLLSRIRQEKMRSWSEVVPDIVHFVSCALATGLCAILLPFGLRAIFFAGIIATLITYVPMTIIRDSLQDIKQSDQ